MAFRPAACALFLGVLGWCGWASAQSLAPLRLSTIPLLGAEATVRELAPLVQSLSRLGGRRVEFVYLDSHEKVLAALREGRIELAVLGPLPYAELTDTEAEAEAASGPNARFRLLARFKEADGAGSYRCVLVAFPDDTAALAQATTLRLAMASRLSTCGPLSARALLAQRGMAWASVQPQYLGNQAVAALAVVAGRAQLASMKASVARQHASLGLQVLAETAPLPGFVLVADAQRVDADTLNKLSRLLDTPATQYRQWGDNLGHGLLPAADTDYEPVRALMRARQP